MNIEATLSKTPDDHLESELGAESPDTSDMAQLDSTNNYTIDFFFKICLPVYADRATRALSVHAPLRTLLDLLIAHSLGLKGLQRRRLVFDDLAVAEFDGVPGIAVRLFVPKPLQLTYYGFVRHFCVELCPQFILAQYLFARFHILDNNNAVDLAPQGDAQLAQYKLLNGGQKLRLLLYSQQYKALCKLSKNYELITVSNLSQVVACHTNDNPLLGALQSVPPNRVPLAALLADIDPEAVFQYAGYTSRQDATPARAQKPVPDRLAKLVFPFADSDTSHMGSLFRALRTLLIQDMVEMKSKYPQNVLCLHPIFQLQEFLEFAGVAPALYRKPASTLSKPPTPESHDSLTSRILHLETMLEHMHQKQEQMARQMTSMSEAYSRGLVWSSKSPDGLPAPAEQLSPVSIAPSENRTLHPLPLVVDPHGLDRSIFTLGNAYTALSPPTLPKPTIPRSDSESNFRKRKLPDLYFRRCRPSAAR